MTKHKDTEEATAYRDASLKAFYDASAGVTGIDDSADINDYSYDDEGMEKAFVKHQRKEFEQLWALLETKSRRVSGGYGSASGVARERGRHIKTPAGARKFGGQIGQLIVPGTNALPVARHKVSKVEVVHGANHGDPVEVRQHTAQHVLVTAHPNMKAADAHIDEVFDHHQHLGSVDHSFGSHTYRVHHDDTVDKVAGPGKGKGVLTLGPGAVSVQLRSHYRLRGGEPAKRAPAKKAAPSQRGPYAEPSTPYNPRTPISHKFGNTTYLVHRDGNVHKTSGAGGHIGHIEVVGKPARYRAVDPRDNTLSEHATLRDAVYRLHQHSSAAKKAPAKKAPVRTDVRKNEIVSEYEMEGHNVKIQKYSGGGDPDEWYAIVTGPHGYSARSRTTESENHAHMAAAHGVLQLQETYRKHGLRDPKDLTPYERGEDVPYRRARNVTQTPRKKAPVRKAAPVKKVAPKKA